MKRTASAVLYGILATVLFIEISFGQQSATGVPPFSSWSGGQFDRVNLANLDVHFQVPILQKAGRGLPFNYDLSYDSAVWTITQSGSSSVWTPAANWGWTQPLFANVGVVSMWYNVTNCTQNGYWIGDAWQEGFSYTDSQGTIHSYNGQLSGTDGNCSGPTVNSFTETAHDGSGLTLSVYGGADFAYATITTPDGVAFDPPVTGSSNSPGGTSIMDSNGNEITSNGSGQFTDTLNTNALTISGSAPTVTYTYTGPSGAENILLKYLPHTIQTSFQCSGISEYTAYNVYLLDNILLPDGTTYQFTYEPTPGNSSDTTGRLASVTLPTKGTITYSYTGGNDGINCSDGGGSGFTRALATNGTGNGTWSYSRAGSSGSSTTSITSPTGDSTGLTFENGFETQRYIYQGNSTLLQTTTNCYNGNVSNCGTTPVSAPITQRATFLQIPGLESESLTFFNSAGQATEIKNYDYGNGVPGSLLRDEFITYASLGNIFDRPSMVLVYGGSGGGGESLVSETKYAYDESGLQTSGAPQHISVSTPRGNLTTLTKYTTISGGSVSAPLSQHFTYYDTGTTYTATDLSGNTTQFTYGECGSSFVTQTTLPLSLSTSEDWNCNGGVPNSTTDMNSNVTSYQYDLMWRPTATNYPDAGQTTVSYNLTASPPNITTSSLIDNSMRYLTNETVIDGFGRTKEQAFTSDPEGTVYKDFFYDSDGRLYAISNPYRSTSDPTYGVTEYAHDALNRVTAITDADNSVKNLQYSNNCVTKWDEAGKVHGECYDALGRLNQLWEDQSHFNYPTFYQYDPLGNLTKVTQEGGTSDSNQWRVRTFAYDGLSRMLTESTPEAGSVNYSYFFQGQPTANLYQRTDARGITATYSYDGLNRVTAVSYSDGTPADLYFYDQANPWGWTLGNPKGRLTTEGTYLNGSWVTAGLYSYDAMGRPVTHETCNEGSCTYEYTTNTSYNLIGEPITATNGEGVTFSYQYDNAGRASQLTSSFVDSQHPGTLATVEATQGYYPSGALRKLTLGNGLTETAAFNNRLQLCRMNFNSTATSLGTCSDTIPSGTVMDLGYSYNLSSSDNGNIANWIAAGAQSFNRSYTYDTLNRLSTMTSTGGGTGLSWTYDAWGNRTSQTVTAGFGYNWSDSVDVHNHLTGSPYTYDADGNLTNDGNHTYTYDAKNRVIAVDGGATASYVYDVEGQRVRKNTASGFRDFVYDLSSRVVAEVTASGWEVGYAYMNGALVAQYQNSTTYFIQKDHLGSTRLMTTLGQSVYDSMDYSPFGEQMAGGTGTTHKFTSMETDTETNLDHTWFRQYPATQGRWMTPDPAGMAAVDPTNPQSWNRYAYVMNNPVNLIDLVGLECYAWDNGQCTNWGSNDGSNPALLGGFVDPFGMMGLISVPDGTNRADGGCAGCIPMFFALFYDPILAPPQGCATPGSNGCYGPPQSPPKKTCEPLANDPSMNGIDTMVDAYTRIVHPLETAAVNMSMFFVSGASFYAGGALVVGGCLEPTPAEPATCIAGGAAGSVLFATGAGAGKAGVSFFKNYTLPAFKSWGCE